MRTTRIVERPQPGDWADHKSGRLDPRRVVNTKPFQFEPTDDFPDGLGITLDIGGETDLIPAANYTFSRTDG